MSLSTFRADLRDRPTHQGLWRLALPMILSNLSVPLVGLVDSSVAGHLGDSVDLGAVAVGGTLYTLLVWTTAFLRMATTGFAAQAYGRRDPAAAQQLLWQSLLLAIGLAVTIGGLTWLLRAALLDWIGASAGLAQRTEPFLSIRLAGYPAALMTYALVGWMVGQQRARQALAVLLTTNLLNAALNPVFALLLDGGVPGIAWASVCGEWCGALLGLVMVRAALRGARADTWAALRSAGRWTSLLAVNRDLLLRTLALEAVFLTLTACGARLGDEVVAANQLLLNGLLLIANGFDGLAQAVEALTGRAIGAGDRSGLRRSFNVSTLWCGLGALACALAFAWGGDAFLALQTSLPEVRAAAGAQLPFLSLLSLVAVWSYLLDGLFIGATRAREMRNSMLIACAVFLLAAAVAVPRWANTGLWSAFIVFMLVRGLTLGGYALRLHRRQGWWA
jgi:MATE family multidrug resistance protein